MDAQHALAGDSAHGDDLERVRQGREFVWFDYALPDFAGERIDEGGGGGR